jgi:hypothetical protein
MKPRLSYGGFFIYPAPNKKRHNSDVLYLVTLLGENWNTFWEELEHFDEGLKDLLPEGDC